MSNGKPTYPIRTVAITGGTHGDERTGVALVQKWLADHTPIARPSLRVTALLTNTPAIAAWRRDMGLDLNRAFGLDALSSSPPLSQSSEETPDDAPPPAPRIVHVVASKSGEETPDETPPERALAQTLNSRLGPKGPGTATDCIIDLHSAHSNMGLNLNITGEDPFLFRLAAHTIMRLTNASPPLAVRCYQFPASTIAASAEDASREDASREDASREDASREDASAGAAFVGAASGADAFEKDAPYLPTIARHGLGVEVGPVAPNALDARLFFATERLVLALLDCIEAYNARAWTMEDPAMELPVYTQVGQLTYPHDCGPVCMLHPDRLDSTYEPIHPGDPLFIDQDGHVTPYTGEIGLVTTFVNEPSYAKAGIALCLARRAVRKV